jgi:hypothetical protein
MVGVWAVAIGSDDQRLKMVLVRGLEPPTY